MNINKKIRRICLAFGVTTILFTTAISAANYTKTINATYRNISVTYNGIPKTLSSEPFLLDGSTYVPLRAVSEIMDASVNWNGSTNVISITNDTNTINETSSSLQQQLATANYQVTTLQRELDSLKKEFEAYKKATSSNR